jgi:hypothetical protein
MGKTIKTNVPNWVLVSLGSIVVMLVASTIGGLAGAENPKPPISVNQLFWLNIIREGIGFVYRSLKDNELPNVESQGK